MSRRLIEFVKKDRGSVDRFFDHCNVRGLCSTRLDISAVLSFTKHPWYPLQSLGLNVIRLWAFNYRMPYAWGKYDEAEFQGLDYIVDSASRWGLFPSHGPLPLPQLSLRRLFRSNIFGGVTQAQHQAYPGARQHMERVQVPRGLHAYGRR